MNVIDTHAHFWDVSSFEYPWIEQGSVFDRTFSLEDYQLASREIPIERMVFIECDAHPRDSLREALWVERLSAQEGRIQGIVARVTLTGNDDVVADLDRAASLPLVKGIRDNIQNHQPGFATQDAFRRGVSEVHKRGLHFELCLRHHQMTEAIDLVERCPEGTFVLDHCGKPDIRAGSREPWLTQIRQLARLPNVVCKISGLVTEAHWEQWQTEEVLWYARQAAEAFGPTRLLWGSDWPVNEAAGGFVRWFRAAQALVAGWTALDQERFFHRNAEWVYRLPPSEV